MICKCANIATFVGAKQNKKRFQRDCDKLGDVVTFVSIFCFVFSWMM